jgi:hypothetical protein
MNTILGQESIAIRVHAAPQGYSPMAGHEKAIRLQMGRRAGQAQSVSERRLGQVKLNTVPRF